MRNDDIIISAVGNKPTNVFLENRIQKINLILNILLIEVKTSEVTKQLNISYGYIMQAQRNADLRMTLRTKKEHQVS